MSHKAQDPRTDVCPTFLVDDLPAVTDAFSNEDAIGPHSRIARAIAEIIANLDDEGGKVIGLEGRWGSGKTTILNLLDSILEETSHVHIFRFDAWAHRGDPLRRVFLESLIQELRTKTEWVRDTRRWRYVLKVLGKKRLRRRTDSTPRIQPLSAVFATLAIVCPVIGASLVGGAAAQGLTVNWNSDVSWLFWAGIGVALFPLVVVSILWTRSRRRKVKTFEQEDDDPDTESESAWAFLLGEVARTDTETATEAPETTSLEFERHFKRLMSEVLTTADPRQLVIVLDNLDRVGNDDAKSLLSTLQVFFPRDAAHTAEPWHKRLWVLLPFDPEGLSALWGDDDDTNSDAFMDKILQTRFQIPPPVLGNWGEYLIRQMKSALPMHEQEELDVVHSIFNVCCVPPGENPTPRKLNIFVNQLGNLHRLWQHEYPLTHLAYFAALRSTLSEHELFLRLKDPGNAFPDSRILRMCDEPDLLQNLAGISFGVGASRGTELILRPEILKQLDTQKGGAPLLALAERYGRSFWAALRSICTDEVAQRDPEALAKALPALELLLEGEDRERLTLRRIVCRIIGYHQIWTPFNKHVRKGLIAGVRLIKEDVRLPDIIDAIRSSVASFARADNDEKEISSLLADTITISELIDAAGVVLASPLELPLSPDEWINAAPLLRTKGQAISQMIHPACGEQEVTSKLVEWISGGRFNKSVVDCIDVSQQNGLVAKIDSLIGALRDRLKAEANAPIEEACGILDQLVKRSHDESSTIGVALKSLAEGNHILHHLQASMAASKIECAARCIVVSLTHYPDGTKAEGDVGNSQQGHKILIEILGGRKPDLVETLLSQLSEEGGVGLLERVVAARSSLDPFVIECLRMTVDDGRCDSIYTSGFLEKHWKSLSTGLTRDGDEEDIFSSLIHNLVDRIELDRKFTEPGSRFDVRNSDLYARVAEAIQEDQRFLQWASDGLHEASSKDWLWMLETGGSTYDLFSVVRARRMPLTFQHPLRDAILGFARKLLDGTTPHVERTTQELPNLIAALATDADRDDLMRSLIQEATRVGAQCSEPFFATFGQLISSPEALATVPHVLRELILPGIRDGALPIIRWFKAVLETYPDIISQFSARERAELGKRLTEDPEPTEDEETQALLSAIAKFLGIHTPAKEGNPTGEDNTAEPRLSE